MSNPRKLIPSYLKHKQSGRARAVWTDRACVRHNKLLPGEYDSEESKAAYLKLVAECAASHAVTDVPPNVITVTEVLLACFGYAQQQYRAVLALSAAPAQATRLFGEKLKPVDVPGSTPGVRTAWNTTGLVSDTEVHWYFRHEPLAHRVEATQDRDRRPVPR